MIEHDENKAVDLHPLDRRTADLLLLSVLVLSMPLLLKRELYAMQHACYVGFGSCVTLALAVVLRAVERFQVDGFSLKLKWWSSDISDWLFAFLLWWSFVSFAATMSCLYTYSCTIQRKDVSPGCSALA